MIESLLQILNYNTTYSVRQTIALNTDYRIFSVEKEETRVRFLLARRELNQAVPPTPFYYFMPLGGFLTASKVEILKQLIRTPYCKMIMRRISEENNIVVFETIGFCKYSNYS